MSRADTLANTFTIIRPFEDLPMVTLFTTRGEAMTTGYVSGQFEVAVSTIDGDWHFSDIWISADNRRTGPDARADLINLDADVDERLFLTILDALEARYMDAVEEDIEAYWAEEGFRRPAA